MRHARLVPLVVTFTLGVAVALGGAAAGAAPKAGPCQLLTTSELRAALGGTFQPEPPYHAGTGITCAYTGVGPVRGATVRIARGKQAKVAMTKTLRALRDTLKSIGSKPPTNITGLGTKAYYSLDTFLGEGGIVVLDGTTFVQVTAIVSANGDTALVSKPVLRGLAKKALARAR